MGKTVTNASGYSFPRMPEKWSETERQFGLGLRDQFDRIYSQDETNDRRFNEAQVAINDIGEKQQRYAESFDYKLNDLENRLTETIGESGETIEEQITEINEEIGTINETIAADKEELLGRIATVYNEVYPIGITVLGSSPTDCPITFGTWEADYTDPVTGDPIPDDCGNYRWRRVADP